MEPQAVYSLSKGLHRLIVDLTEPDQCLVKNGLITVYTRNHAIAATALTHGFSVQWKPWMQEPRACKVAGSQIVEVIGNPICEIEADFDSPIGIRVVSVEPDILEQIEKAKAKE